MRKMKNKYAPTLVYHGKIVYNGFTSIQTDSKSFNLLRIFQNSTPTRFIKRKGTALICGVKTWMK